MTAKPPATRQAELEARKKAAGLLRFTRWVHPDDLAALDALHKKLAGERAKQP